uniref:Endonuclease/exonuclease/phosphatase domain-containing protein n=1 Tax=Acanthochromis polyacanthus TaxID=80966 RepID=A0A3Q1HXH1_9TELE
FKNNGRWTVMDITINDLHIILGNVYAPNEDEPVFFSELRTCLKSIKVDQIIVTGDFNTVLDMKKDRSSYQKCNNHPHALREIQEMVASLELVDIFPKISNCSVGGSMKPDHSLVTLQMN